MIRGTLIGISASSLLYTIYVQFHSSMGGVWLRPNEDGGTVFCPMSLVKLMFAPVGNRRFWVREMLRVNWIVWAVFGGLAGALVEAAWC